MEKKCIECGITYKTDDKRRKFCSNRCYHIKSKRELNKGTFKKGIQVWNKNMKGIHLSPLTEFKKGQESLKKLPLGKITKRIDKNKNIRNWIKIEEPNIWMEYSRFIWIKNNGEIPQGFVIHHIDKNSLNDNIENLCCLTRKAHISIHREDFAEARIKPYLEQEKLE